MHTFNCKNLYGNGTEGIKPEPIKPEPIKPGRIKLDRKKIAIIRSDRDRINKLIG